MARDVPTLNRLLGWFVATTVHFSARRCIFAATEKNRISATGAGSMRRSRSLAVLAFAAAAASPAVAQQPANPSAPPALPIPAVGDMAPDFTLSGATRFGA